MRRPTGGAEPRVGRNESTTYAERKREGRKTNAIREITLRQTKTPPRGATKTYNERYLTTRANETAANTEHPKPRHKMAKPSPIRGRSLVSTVPSPRPRIQAPESYDSPFRSARFDRPTSHPVNAEGQRRQFGAYFYISLAPLRRSKVRSAAEDAEQHARSIYFPITHRIR